MRLASIYLLCIATNAQGSHHKISDSKQISTWILNQPLSFQSRRAEGIIDARSDSSVISQTEKVINIYRYYSERGGDVGTDNEIVDALDHFFYGTVNGTAMELGGLDGKIKSMTRGLEENLIWRRIIVEGNPHYNPQTIALNPNAYSVNAAVCANESVVHYASHTYPQVAGIMEFMSPSFLQEFYPKWYKHFVAANMTWHDDEKSWKFITPVMCMPLSKILHQAFITHVDFFVLDVEGAEFEILKSIDWNNFLVSVMCIETDPPFRPPGYVEKIREYLEPKGYKIVAQKGRNSWYIHKDFVPFARPGLPVDCYRGHTFLKAKEEQPACKGYEDLE